MKPVSAEQLDRIAEGIVAAEHGPKGWFGRRMPMVLMDHYRATEGHATRAVCTSGVRLVFRTDSQKLALTLRYGRRARDIFTSDLLVDGDAHSTIGPAEVTAVHRAEVELGSGGGEKRVELHLPTMCETWVDSVEIDESAGIEPVREKRPKWLVLGDSITQGMETPRPIENVVGRCMLQLGLNAINLAVGGATLDAVLGQAAETIDADLVTIAYGTNDFNQAVGVDTYLASARTVVDGLRQSLPAAQIALISAPDWAEPPDPNANGETLQQYREALHELGDERSGITVIDGGDLIPADQRFFVDSVHPNADGFARYGDHLIVRLRSML